MKGIDPRSHPSSLGNFPSLLKRPQTLKQSCKHVTSVTSVTTKLKKMPFFYPLPRHIKTKTTQQPSRKHQPKRGYRARSNLS
jgi:hypothetical protein